MAIILPHGVLFRGGAEAKIRRKLLDDGHYQLPGRSSESVLLDRHHGLHPRPEDRYEEQPDDVYMDHQGRRISIKTSGKTTMSVIEHIEKIIAT